MAKKIVDIDGLDAFLEECVTYFISKKTLHTVNELLLEIPESEIWFDVNQSIDELEETEE